MANLYGFLAGLINYLLHILYWLLIIRAILSWVEPDPHNLIVQLIYKVTEPIVYPIRKLLPVSFSFVVDISPVVAFLIIFFLRPFIVKILINLSAQ